MRALVPLLLLVAGCGDKGPDLPAGWEEATLLIDFGQSECTGDPLDDPDGVRQEINVSVLSGAARVTWTNVTFRCEQAVEAYIKRTDTAIDLLVQPVDILPDEVARCDCLYDLDLRFNVDDSVRTVAFFTRQDEVGGPSSPVEVGSIDISGG